MDVGPALKPHTLASSDVDVDRRAAGPVNREVHLVATRLDPDYLSLAPPYLGDLHAIEEDVVGPPTVCPSRTRSN